MASSVTIVVGPTKRPEPSSKEWRGALSGLARAHRPGGRARKAAGCSIPVRLDLVVGNGVSAASITHETLIPLPSCFSTSTITAASEIFAGTLSDFVDKILGLAD